MSNWAIEDLEAYSATQTGAELERIRVVGQSRAYRSDEPKDLRLRWAKLSLDANARLHSDDAWDRARAASQNFALRTWIISNVGSGTDPDWDPCALAADTLAVLTMKPREALEIASGHPNLGQIGELRRHRNLTAHLDVLVRYLDPGPVRDQFIAWIEAREHLR